MLRAAQRRVSSPRMSAAAGSVRMAEGTVADPRPDLLDTTGETGGEWIVIVFDNSKNTFEEVIGILQQATGCNLEEAEMETVGGPPPRPLHCSPRRPRGVRARRRNHPHHRHSRGSRSALKHRAGPIPGRS